MLVLACDLPFVTPALLQRLVEESGTGEEIDAVVPRSARGLEPLCALYRDALRRPRPGPASSAGDLKVAGLLADLRVRELGREALAPYDDGSLFENVNTPHDHARARGWVELNEKPSEDRITE